VNQEDTDKKDRPGKIGEYLECNPEAIPRALDVQKNLCAGGKSKRLGEILLHLKEITPEKLSKALILQRIARLKKSSLFAGSNDNEIEKISHLVFEKPVKKGEIVIEQDSSGDCLLILIEGEMEVFRKGEYDEIIPLGTINPGESMGEMGYFSDGRRSASVIAAVDSQLITIRFSDIKEIFDRAPRLAVSFLEIVTRRLRQSNLKFEKTVQKARRIESAISGISELMDLSQVRDFKIGIKDLIERVVITAGSVMKADRASLFLVDSISGELWSVVAVGETHREIRIPIGSGIAGWVAKNDSLLNIKDAYNDSRFNPEVDRRTGYTTRNILCGPVKNLGGETVGVIQVINKKGGDFDAQDEELFKAFAYQTAISVENFNMYNRISENYARMSIFLDVATSVSTTLDLNTLIKRIVEKITEILKADRSSLFILDREKNELWSKVAEGTEISEIRFSATTGMAGHTALTGEIINTDDAYQDPRFNPEHDQATGYRTKSVLCVPVINRKGDVIGVTQSINKQAGPFTGEDEEIMRALSSQIAVALENARLYEDARDMKNYLENIHNSITDSIITLDNAYRVVTTNRATLRMLALDESAVTGRDIRDILGSENSNICEKIDRVYADQAAVSDYDIPVSINGAEKSANISMVPLADDCGNQKGQVIILEDISFEKRMKTTLTRYMAKDIVEKLINDPNVQTLGGSINKASILFSDIRGFTGISENLSPEQVVDFLNRYFSLMVDVVFKNEGILDKYIGDTIMAVFGVPYARDGDAVRAVRTALQMKKLLLPFNREMTSRCLAPIRIGIGISTGRVLSGNIGSEKRMDFTVIGDGVNISSRLESLNKQYGTTILLEEKTRKEISDTFEIRMIDHVLVKGRTEPFAIFEALCEKGRPLPDEISFFQKGLDFYLACDFAEAMTWFKKGRVSDPPCRAFFDRCAHFLKNPPSPEWDGVWVLENK